MERRTFVGAVAGAFLTLPFVVEAGGISLLLARGPILGQPPPQIARIGVLWFGSM